jgi:peptide deformylase
MPLRPIVRLGHPVLRTAAAPVSTEALRSNELQALVDDMVETMREAHGVGLAAPQVGVGSQLFVYEVRGDDEDPGIPLRVVINPMLDPQPGELVYDWEGCLSIPELRGLVPRHPGVRVRGLDREGRPLDYVAWGFEARIIQHEFDHLNGVVYLDRMRGLESLAFEAEFEQFFLRDGAPEEPSALG